MLELRVGGDYDSFRVTDASSNSLLAVNFSGAKIGIGTTSPGSRFEIKGSTADSTASSLNVTNSAGTTMLYVRNDGKIGMGTTSPSSDLSFGGDTARIIKLEVMSSNAAGNALSVAAGAAGSGASAFSGGSLNLSGGAAAGTGNANGGYVVIGGGAGVGTGSQGGIYLNTSGGKVGIGTSLPSYILHVVRDAGVSSNEYAIGFFGRADTSNAGVILGYGANGTNDTYGFLKAPTNFKLGLGSNSDGDQMLFDLSGNVGIGTDPESTAKLTVYGRIRGIPISGDPIFSFAGDTNTGMTNYTGNDILTFLTNGSDRLTIDSNGNVGINNTSQFGSGVGVVGLKNATTDPAAPTSGYGILYMKNGALRFRGATSDTEIAPV
ncbi:MAG: hypothetical protein HY547_04940 [Elusimicrobia bacterium]|nr:hypothetical protein [Elusimicrobiota bacterium]